MSDVDALVNRVGPGSSGLTLVLPSLKALKELNAKKGKSPVLEPTQVKKVPRPIKLKPLKEVLTTLISKIKKKDDYAFFLEPVDVEKVPGYMDVVKQPMDFGTMADKVSKSKYRSLDEFADDFRLVISNAKTFNPPGTIYHNEAERIESWASDHISKAASYVIEYETDWNIEVDRDEDVNVDADEDGATGGGVPAGPDTPGRRSPSVGSASVPPPNRRGKNASKKEGLSEALELDGHLPGFKDGVGVFPPGSDWAEVMLALKLKGKRYRSKKERLRMEKGGPPYAADGSLDYTEMEDPFSVLSAIVPDPPFSPLLTPLIQDSSPPLPTGAPSPKDPSVAPEPPVGGTKSKYRHWTIIRQLPQRTKAKETVEERPSPLDSKKPRLLHTTDFGLFPTIAAKLSSGATIGTEEELLTALHTSLESSACSENSENQAAIAQIWLREVVYGGFDGLAYMRSVAEFVTPHGVPPATGGQCPDLPNPVLTEYVDNILIDELTERRHRTIEAALTHPEVPGSSSSSHATIVPEPPIVLPTPLDLGSLISAPNELFDAENAWVAAGMKEDSAVLSSALDHAAHLLEELNARRAGPGGADENAANEADLETELRMNLIALAKRHRSIR
ncbi:hypothetical protein EI94DRAFT_1587444 [Lactarius quietus]|nr:hypothetical protein EI94DRAFT_1587444 [Lactarius quietus]